MFCLALAAAPSLVQMPAHGRVNGKCYPVWNSGRSNLDVVWNGAIYSQPWRFDAEPSGLSTSCVTDRCVQRLICMDSGVIGYYNSFAAASTIEAYWLMNRQVGARISLTATSDGQSIMYGDEHGHGTIAVSGNTLYFHVHDVTSTNSLPYLGVYTFDEYREGAKASDLAHRTINAFRILDYQKAFSWDNSLSPIYVSQADSVTVSIEQGSTNQWAIDAVVSVQGDTASRGPLVYYQTATSVSVLTVSRNIITAPGYSCFAKFLSKIQCAHIDNGKYTWQSVPSTELGMQFDPMTRIFDLPDNFYLTMGKGTYYGISDTYVGLVGAGLTPQIAFHDDVMYALGVAEDETCISGKMIFMEKYTVGDELQLLEKTPVICYSNPVLIDAHYLEASFSTTLLKWPGPWFENFKYFVSTEPDMGHYYGEKVTTYVCSPGYYRTSTGCQICPNGYYCDNTELKKCSIKLGQGAAKCEICGADVAWYEGRCTDCTSLPIDMACKCTGDLCVTRSIAGLIIKKIITIILSALCVFIGLIIIIVVSVVLCTREKKKAAQYQPVLEQTVTVYSA